MKKILTTLIGASLLVSANAAEVLSQDKAKAIVAPFYQALNAGNDAVTLINTATSEDWVSCGGNDDSTCFPRDKVAPKIAGFSKIIPDLKWEIKETYVAGNNIIVRGEASGTPSVDFMGVPYGGQSFKVMSIDIHTVKDGKIVRSHHVEDWATAMQQLSK